MPPIDTATTAGLTTEGAPPLSLENILSWETLLRWIDTPIVTVGSTRLTLISLVLALAIIVLFIVLSGLVQRLLGPWLNERLRRSPGVSYAIQRFVHYLIILIGIIFSSQMIGLDLSSFAIVLGFLSVGIGFGLQNLTSNFISGLILLIERPISVGDLVQVDDQIGRVAEINMRSSVIVTLENVSLIVPNSKFIENNVVNWSHGDPKIQIRVPVGVAYGSDLDLVTRTLLEAASGNQGVLKYPKPEVRFREFGDSSLNFRLLVWIDRPADQYRIHSELNYAIDAAFRKAAIVIPFPQRDVHIQTPPGSP